MLDERLATLFAAVEDDLRNSKPEVILVEDDPSVLRALHRLLEVSGFKVTAFARPSALQAAGITDQNACLIFDVHLPSMDGRGALPVARRIGLPCSLDSLILITAHVDETTRAMIQRVQAAAVMVKPFSRDSLLNAIRQSLASAENSF
jgi:two-component system, NtrC family, C4-dicarboxylate transport response regulator DctD